MSRRAAAWVRAVLEHDWIVLAGLVALATVVRFVGLEARGRFDGDQGHDVLVLLRLVRDGTVPLLGPPTSIGDFHHGAAYYYLLAPAAWLSGANPTAIVAWIAGLGVAAVAATWWFARAVGGPLVAALAGLLMAVSPAAIDESTFIWNPNPIPLFAALALGSAWRAHSGGRARWWILALVAAAMVVQLHVLGIVFLPPILGLAVADAVGAWRSGDRPAVRRVLGATAAGLGLAALLFVPLLIHELGTGFEETGRIADFLAGRGADGSGDPFGQLAITLFRIVGWPLVGLITTAPAGAIVVVTATGILSIWLAIAGRGSDHTVARWLGLSVLWSGVALSILAPSLRTVVPELPNDHYHSFLDPVVIVLVVLATRAIGAPSARRISVDRQAPGMAGQERVPGDRSGIDIAARSLVGLAIASLVVLEVAVWPPAVDPNGGWPEARAGGERIVAGFDGPFDVRQLPTFKTAEGVGYPVLAAGGDAVIATDAESALRPVQAPTLVVACDRVFEDVIGYTCGGLAESAYLRRLTGEAVAPQPAAQFDWSPRITIMIFRLGS